MTAPTQRPCNAVAIDWEEALALHGSWLRSVVTARVGEAQAVDEVLQEVALAAVRQQAPLADGRKLAPWLYRLAVRQSLLYRRRMGRARRHAARYAERQEPREGGDPLHWLLSLEQRALVRKAMGRLAPRDAEILLLKYEQNWSYQEIARHLGVSESAVEARLHRARSRMRAELTALCGVEAAV